MERPFFGRIESLRGIACLAVAGYHATGIALHGIPLLEVAQGPTATWAQRIIAELGLLLMPGRAALMMFFVISGCVLRVSLQYGPQGIVAATRRFFIARIFRIFPIVVVGVLVAVFALTATKAASFGEPPLTWTNLLANSTLISVDLNSVLWALQVEVLMAPFIVLFYFVERRFGPKSVLAIALVATPLAFCNWLVWGPLSHNFYTFVLGLTVPTIGRGLVEKLSPAQAKWLALVAAVALFLPGRTLGFFTHTSGVIETYAAFFLVSLAASRSDTLNWLDARPLRLLGQSSGSYYVLHMFFLPAACVIASLVITSSWCQNAPALAMWAAIIIFLVTMVPIAIAGFYLIESPGMAAGRYLNRLLQPQRPPRTVASVEVAEPARVSIR